MAGKAHTRREALLVTMASLGTAFGFSILPTHAFAGIFIPSHGMLLKRRLIRGLNDGNKIIVDRGWNVQFTRQSQGIAITGTQISVSVSAPKALASFVEIEKARSTQNMFPILLSPEGTIMAAGSFTSQESVAKALTTAEDFFIKRGLSAANAAQQIRAMEQLQQSSAKMLDEMPGDLFYPSTQPVRQARSVNLPNGAKGEFEVSWQASTQAGETLLKHARREVITRIGKSERVSSEEWWLERV